MALSAKQTVQQGLDLLLNPNLTQAQRDLIIAGIRTWVDLIREPKKEDCGGCEVLEEELSIANARLEGLYELLDIPNPKGEEDPNGWKAQIAAIQAIEKFTRPEIVSYEFDTNLNESKCFWTGCPCVPGEGNKANPPPTEPRKSVEVDFSACKRKHAEFHFVLQDMEGLYLDPNGDITDNLSKAEFFDNSSDANKARAWWGGEVITVKK